MPILKYTCDYCKNVFERDERLKKYRIKTQNSKHDYCNKQCAGKAISKVFNSYCGHCSKSIIVRSSEHKKSKSGLSFCSKSCSCTYSNIHKTTGTRRSKLEIWLEEQLIILYPTLEILFNKKETINSELDIHVPSLDLAIELNGIFHYEPIYGADKLLSIQNNDSRKFQACLEQNIELVIIDTSSMKYFKPANCQKYLDIIRNIIDMKISSLQTTNGSAIG